MKNIFTVFLLLIGTVSFSQTLTLTSPSGLTEPYEVASGTIVTVEWSYFSEEPTYMLTYDQDPGSNLNTDWQFFLNSEWTSGSGWTNNGDGTWSWDVTITEETWIFGAFNTFSGNTYSNVIHVNIASDVVIDFEDGLICATGDTETLTVASGGATIEWYQDDVLIDGETSSTYDATSAGSYYAIVDGTQSNTLVIEELSIDFTGMLSMDATEITFTADAGMDAYQWYSGLDMGSMTAITGATNAEYTATLTSDLTYYHVVGTLGTCDVTSMNKSVSEEMFTPVSVEVSADTNEYGQLCDGTSITLSIPEDTENFTWFRNDVSSWQTTTSITIANSWSTGIYYVITNPMQWPEIDVQSNSIDASYYELIEPALYGADNNSLHCAGEEITIDLADEGYTYTWYAHTTYTYNDTDLISVPTNSYTFTFEEGIKITVVGSFQGCETESTLNLNAYSEQSIYVGISNYDQQYLCIDSSAYIGLASYSAVNYSDFVWYQKDGDVWIEILGEDSNYYAATEPGFYKMQATSINCATAVIESNEYEVKDYLERPLYLYTDQTEMCLGDTANLNMYSNQWTSIQWLKGDIQIGDSGYEMQYVPLSGAGTENSAIATEFNHYVVKARHNSCPNGLKNTSDPVVIKPSVNPDVIVDLDVNNYQVALWDSSIFYLDCVGNSITLSVEDIYDSYQWYTVGYAGIDDYELGDPIPGATSDSVTAEVQVQWMTLEVELDGCIGYTDPVLLDGWAFQDPVIASYDNNQICPGDSALIHLAFPSTWIEYYWTLDGEVILNSDNDSLWVTEPGEYIIWAYPEECPTALFTSGQGPFMQIFEALIFEDEDEFGNGLFYAYPWQGQFTYQWYLDGEPIDNPSEIPSVFWKDDLEAGVVTVEIINTDGCTSISEGILWDPSGVDENFAANLSIYPNPSNGIVNIEGLTPQNETKIKVYNTQGQVVRVIEVFEEKIELDISDLKEGIYLFRIQDSKGNSSTYTVNKL